MTTGNTTLLGLALPVEGELDGTWGDVVNDSLTSLVDSAVAGTTTLSADADVTLTDTALAANQARQAVLLWTASNGASTRNITAPARSKPYIVINAGTGSIVLRGAGPTTGVTIAASEKCLAAWNGSDFVKIATSVADGVTSVGGTGTVNGITLTGTVTSTGNLTLGGTLSNVNLTSQVTGTLPVANGGTGITSFGAGVATFLGTPSSANLAAAVTDETGSGALVFATSPTLVTPALGTPASGVLTNATGLPLSTGVTGTLPVANGGTGATSLTANNVLLGNGTSALQVVAPGTSGNVLTSNGTTWTSAAAGAALSGVTDSGSPFETALGHQAGNVNTGTNNTFIGYRAGLSNTTGTETTAVGSLALDANTTGSNTALGFSALGSNTTGSSNTGIGRYALSQNVTGAANVAVGDSALSSNVGSSNVAVGQNALGINTTGASNVALGRDALGANTTASNNTAVGYQALDANTTGVKNVAIGANALGANTEAQDNTAVGQEALRLTTTGSGNSAFGVNALDKNTIGTYNVAVGYYSLWQSTTGNSNTAIGTSSLGAVTTGTQNVAIGENSAYSGTNNLTTGSNNILIGYNAAASSATVSNEITLGNSSIATLRCQVTTITSLSDERDKTNIVDLDAGLNLINAVRPVAFDWNMRDGGKVGEHDTGFIAQELQAAQEVAGVSIPGLVLDNNPEKLEAGYGKLLPVMVKAIQELSAKVDALQAELNQLKGA
jgi:hypothetical protein